MSNLKKYEDFTAADAQTLADEVSKGTTGGFYKFKPGSNIIRILPGCVGGVGPIVSVAQHSLWKLPGIDTIQGKRNVNCAQLIGRRPCVFCELGAVLQRSGNEIDYHLAEEIRPKRSPFAAIISRREEERGILLCELKKSIVDELTEIRADTRMGGNWASPEADGVDLNITKKGTGFETKYTTKVDMRCPLMDDEEMAVTILDSLPNLKTLLALDPPDVIEKTYGAILRPYLGTQMGQRTVRARVPQAAPNTTAPRKRTAHTVDEDMSIVGDGDNIPF